MPEQLFANVASTTITSTITAVQTTLAVASSAAFPSAVSAQDKEFQAAFVDDATTPPTIREYITVRNVNSSTSWTVIRAAEDSSRFPAGAWTSGTRIVHLFTAEGFRDLLPRSRNIYHDVRDYGAVGTNNTANVDAVECGEAFFLASEAANFSVNENYKTDANGTGVVYVPGNRDYKIGAAITGTTESTVGTVPWGLNTRMVGGTGTGSGTTHPPRIRWHGPANGIMFGVHTSSPNIAGVHVENIKFDGRNGTGGTDAGNGNGAATAWEFGPATPGGSGGKVDTGCGFVDVHLGSFNGDAVRFMAGSTNFDWTRGRQDHIFGYAFYILVATGFYGVWSSFTFDNAVGLTENQSKGWMFVDGEATDTSAKSWIGVHDAHLEINGGLNETFVPTGWSATGADKRGVIRFGISTSAPGTVQHLFNVTNLTTPTNGQVSPFSVFQITSLPLSADNRARHATAVRIIGDFPSGPSNGGSSSEESDGAVKLVGGINNADNFPYLPGSGTSRLTGRFSFHPNNSQFVPGTETAIDYFGGRTQMTDVWVGNQKYFDVGSGQGVIHMFNAASVPTGTATGGGVLYVESGALKYRGANGTVTTLGVT